MFLEARRGALALVAACALGCFALEAGPLKIAERGRPSAYSVVVGEHPSECLMHAAEEFTNYVAKLTDVELPVVERTSGCGRAVRLSAVGGLGRDAFRFRTERRDFVIEGDDGRAVLFGVYDFLENRCGCDWVTSDQEIVPYLDGIEIPEDFNLLRKPAFENRENTFADVFEHPDFAAKLKLNGYRTTRWQTRHGGPPKRQFDEVLWKCHTLLRIFPVEKYFKDHPEYYAEVNGVRKGEGRVQLCLANPEVVSKTIEFVKERIRKGYPDVKVYGVSQSDAMGYCTCAACKAIDDREDSPAGSIISFVNQVAEAVEGDYPDVIIETLAYMYSRKPPKTLKPRDNVMICLCTDTCDFSKPLAETKFRFGFPGRPKENAFVDDLKAWCAIAKHVHVWDYTMNFRFLAHAFPNVYSLKPNLETFASCGVREVFEQGDRPGRHQAGVALKAYLIGRLLWDPHQPLEPLLDRFYCNYYGKAASFMRQYMEELHTLSRRRDEAKNPMMMWGVLTSPALPDSFFERGAELYAKAAEAVKDDPVRLRNVQWEMNCNDYTRIMRQKPCIEVGTPRFLELQNAAKRIVDDWRLCPAAQRVSEDRSICAVAQKRIRGLAEFDSKSAGRVDLDALLPKSAKWKLQAE